MLNSLFSLLLMLLLLPCVRQAAPVIEQAKFATYSTSRQAEIRALQLRPTTTGSNTSEFMVSGQYGI